MNKVAVVTGGASGIGEACCQALAKDGFSVAVADVNAEGARKVASELSGAGHRDIYCDVTEEESVIGLIDEVEATMGPITVLACVAGAAIVDPSKGPRIVNTEVRDWDATQDLNARGTFLCIREYLRKREKVPVENGRIILTASTAAYQGNSPTGPAYAASKGAVVALTRVAAMEAGPLSITVNAVAPGTVETPAVMRGMTPELIERAAKATPLGRTAQSHEIADVVAFLASPKAGFMTGSIVHANGGRVMV
jgi:3-oxoacyl-[acyl-carrier protein] reductase